MNIRQGVAGEDLVSELHNGGITMLDSSAWMEERIADLTLQAWGVPASDLDSYWYRASSALCHFWRSGENLRCTPVSGIEYPCPFCYGRDLCGQRVKVENESSGASLIACATCVELLPEMARRIGEQLPVRFTDE